MDSLENASNESIKLPSIEQQVFDGIQGGRYSLVQTKKQFIAALDFLMRQPIIAVDTETSGLNWVFSDACGIVIGAGAEHNYYFAIDHKLTSGEFVTQLELDEVREGFQLLLGNPKTVKIFWHAKFDLHVLKKAGIVVDGIIHDGLTMYHLLDENVPHGLKDTSIKHIDKNAACWEKDIDEWRTLEARRRRSEFQRKVKARVKVMLEDEENFPAADFDKDKLKEIAKQELKDSILARNTKEDITYDYIPLPMMVPYACADTHYTWLLFKKFYFELSVQPKLWELYLNEMRLNNVLFQAEQHGMKVNAEYLKEAGPKFDEEIARYKKEIISDLGQEFNIDSDDELVKAFHQMGVKLTKPTKGSAQKLKDGDYTSEIKYSVDRDVLQGLAAQYEFANKILKYREAGKLKHTYVEGILKLLDDRSYIHTSFNANVSTGRMSCRDPNLQNIPASNKSIRRAFTIPNDEFFYVFIDYSQVELRLTAHWSEDSRLMQCYPWKGQGTDVHTLTTANIVMNLPLEEVLKMMKDSTGHDPQAGVCECPSCQVKFYRSIAKRVNFGIIYGAGPKAIQRQVSTPKRFVSEEDCKVYIQKYLDYYSGVKYWVKDTRRKLKTDNYVVNTFGRYRRFPGFNDLLNWQQDRNARQGCNFLIQGDAADLFKHAAVRVHQLLEGRKTKIVNFVHDEIQFYAHKDEIDLIPQIKSAMEDFPQFKVPIVAEISLSTTNWADKSEMK